MSEVSIVDIHEICRTFATDQLKEDEQKKAKNASFDFENITIQYGEPRYEPKSGGGAAESVVVTSSCVNRTCQERPHTFTLNRHTTSECCVSLSRCFKWGGDISLQLPPPNPVMAACTGMTGELQTNTPEAVFTKQLLWIVEQQVTVPPTHRATARLQVTEKQYMGDFEQLVTLFGPFSVNFESKKGETGGTGVKANLEQALTHTDGFGKDDRGRATFKVRGSIRAHWGIGQVLSVGEEKITGDQMVFKLEM